MKKNQTTATLKALISKALQSMKIYADFGGDSCGIDVLASLFKWPDVTISVINILDDVEGAEEQAISDIGQIMLKPLMALSSALLSSVELSKESREVHERNINATVDFKNVKDIVNKRESLVFTITELTALRGKQNEDRNSGGDEQENGV
jgi:hypothetical protein